MKDEAKNLVNKIVNESDTIVVDGKVYVESSIMARIAGSAVAASQAATENSDNMYDMHRAAGVLSIAELLMAFHTAVADKHGLPDAIHGGLI